MEIQQEQDKSVSMITVQKTLFFCKVQFTYSVPLLILIIVRIMHRRFWHDRTGLQRPCSWPCFINVLRITKQRDQEFAIYTENYNNILNLFLLLPSVPFLHEVTGLASCATFKIQVNSSSIKTQYICAMNSIVHVAHTEVRGQIDGPVVAKTKSADTRNPNGYPKPANKYTHIHMYK